MQLTAHTSDEFLQALKALLPPGDAWQWPDGGTGHALLLGTAQEPVRLEAQVQTVLDDAIAAHRVAAGSWRLVDYQTVASTSQSGVAQQAVSVSRPSPLAAGFKTGRRVWGPRARYVLLVSFLSTTVNAQALWDALIAFKLAHIFIWMVDASGQWSWYVQN
jgi:hypothetical protein